MKKAVVASLLAVASMTVVPGSAMALCPGRFGVEPAGCRGSGPSVRVVQMSPAEYKAYNDAISVTIQAKAAALEGYLTAYPQSAVKSAVLQQLMAVYSRFLIRQRRWIRPIVYCRSTRTTCAL